MKKIVFCFIILLSFAYTLLAQNAKEIEPYTNFLKGQEMSSKEYILSLFKENDIVILCERDHRELTQYKLFLEVISDPYFIEHVGAVFTEVGARNLEPEINTFLQHKNLSQKELDKYALNYQRDCGFYPFWGKSNFSFFIKSLYNINQKTPSNKPILFFPSDLPKRIQNPSVDKIRALYKTYSLRDSLMADYIINKFDSLQENNIRKKALVIMNYRHAFGNSFYMKKGVKADNVGRYLFETYPGKTANVMINSLAILSARSDTDITFGAIQDGKWDASFKQCNIDNVGFSFKNSPFGDDSFDYWPWKDGFTYKDVFNGFVFYMPVDKFEIAQGIPHFLDDGFYEEYIKRKNLYYESINKPAPQTDKGSIMYYNEVHINKMDDLDKLNSSILKWLE